MKNQINQPVILVIIERENGKMTDVNPTLLNRFFRE